MAAAAFGPARLSPPRRIGQLGCWRSRRRVLRSMCCGRGVPRLSWALWFIGAESVSTRPSVSQLVLTMRILFSSAGLRGEWQ
jgi:hypothetical protein